MARYMCLVLKEAVYILSPALGVSDLKGFEPHGVRTWANCIHFKNSGEINEKNFVGLSVCRHAIERASQLRAKPEL